MNTLGDLDEVDLALVAALRDGLPLCTRPYQALGEKVSLNEEETLLRIQALADTGIIRRFGAVVRHHEAGYGANAMVVFDIPDDQVATIAPRLAREDKVTLCYRRERALPRWPYNLYCMIHGRDRQSVCAEIEALVARNDLDVFPRKVLFSRRRFKQTAGRYGREACHTPDRHMGAPAQ